MSKKILSLKGVLSSFIVIAVGFIGYSLLSEGDLYANHNSVADMGKIFSLEQLPEKRTVIEHSSGRRYAGTDSGLFISEDGGKQWRHSFSTPLPVTLITSLKSGDLYTFVAGKGLLKMERDTNQWTLINNKLGSQVILTLSIEDGDNSKLTARNQYGKYIISEDGGESWRREDGLPNITTAKLRAGEKLFNEKCQSCHGIAGVGETYTVEALTNTKYLMAPALDESAHAWHHTDEALIKTILEGSTRQSRMPAWGEAGVTKRDAAILVAYIKSLWGERIKGCQGAKHMSCM
ncbi:MAG: cytochrome c [Thiotrichales bacterium]|mgnify:FL=1|nr:cytochrome c [Thiotrichales bacterium]MBT3613063.1 cytochrome c [Thiotrichales bacterium]MBT3751965.1 cytochrome c [Thiotrichales bacterium]MBT3837669.1 cytochrome c [Thiotrichales bacterium]MBT4262418.1 cytochrome c [Thiotrichales bacterium]